MTPAAFIKEINSSGRKPLYIISGGEPSAVKRCLTAAEDAVSPDFRDFNHQTLDLSQGQVGRLIGEAGTMPFLAPPRIVLTKNPAFEQGDWNSLADYLENPNSSSTILIVLDKIDARLKFFKKIKSADLEVDCRQPKGAALVKWLMEEFKGRGITAPESVCNLIIDRAGTDLNTLSGEVEKLSLYLGEGTSLSAELVRKMVSLSPNANIFELGEALGRRDLKKAWPPF